MKHVINIAGFIGVLALMEFLVTQVGEVEALRPLVGGLESNLTVDEWLRQFFSWATDCVVVGGLTFVVWYLFGQFTSPNWRGTASKRPWWIIGIIFPCLMALAAMFMLPTAQTGTWLANVFFFFNGIFTYWLISAMFSPTMVKTHVPASAGLRRLRDALPW